MLQPFDPRPPEPQPSEPRPTEPEPRAAGAFIALAVIGGALAGVFLRQPSAGVVGGAALGIAVAIAFWLADRRR